MITKKYYKLVRVSHADSDYFRVTNVDTTAGTLTINGTNNLGVNLEYSTDGVNWTTADSNAPFSLSVPAGANVYMRGTNSSFDGKTIKMTVKHKIGGNIYSILDKATYASRTNSVGNYEFRKLFLDNQNLVSSSEMTFGNVTTLKDYCYNEMFKGCIMMTDTPELPATTLAINCYASMFCWSGIEHSPILPVRTLTYNGCYYSMFWSCSNLKSVYCLAENITSSTSSNYTNNWMDSVSNSGTFYKSTNATEWPRTKHGIPSGWTVVDA